MLRASEIEQLRVDKLSISGSLLVRAAEKLGLRYRLLPERTILISNGTSAYFFKGTSVPCNDTVAAAISDNKYLSRQLFRKVGIPTPRTIVIRNPAAWEKALQSRLNFPLVVKPIQASHSGGSMMDIHRRSTLHKAVERAFRYMKRKGEGDRALVEEYFAGDDLRLLVIGDRVVSVLRRRPAYVIGNGQHTIKELMQAFNNEWKSSLAFDYPLCPIPLDIEVHRYLRRSNKTVDDIPAAGEEVQLRWNGNVSTGGRTFDITNDVHPAIKEMAVKAARAVHLGIAGIDVLVKDYKRGDTSRYNMVVLEANDAPGIDIHQIPYEGAGCQVGELILDFIFNSTWQTTMHSTELLDAVEQTHSAHSGPPSPQQTPAAQTTEENPPTQPRTPSDDEDDGTVVPIKREGLL